MLASFIAYAVLLQLQLRVSSSQSKNKIYVGNIPRAFSQEQIDSAIRPHVIGSSAVVGLLSFISKPSMAFSWGDAVDSQLILASATVGLEHIEVLQSKDFPGQNRGFCFLEFYNHACAQKAKTTLDTGSFK